MEGKVISVNISETKGVVKKSAERFKRTRRCTRVLQAVRLKCSSRAKTDRNPQFCGFLPKFIPF